MTENSHCADFYLSKYLASYSGSCEVKIFGPSSVITSVYPNGRFYSTINELTFIFDFILNIASFLHFMKIIIRN